MPQVVVPALIAGGAAGVGGAIAGGFVLSSILTPAAIAFTSTLVIGGINSVLYKKPKNDYPFLIGSGGQNITGHNAAPPRQLVYGKTRVGGEMFYRETTGNNKLLHIMVAYAGHEIEAYTAEFFFGSDVINPFNYPSSDSRLIGAKYTSLNVNFEPYNLYAGWITRGTNSSFNFQKAFGSDLTAFEVTGSIGINNGIYRRLITKESDIRETAIRVERIDNKPMAAETGSGIGIQIQHIWIYGVLGTTTQAAQALTGISDQWKPGYKAKGVAYCWYQLAWNPRLFPQGRENLGAVIKGKKVYDPRASTTVWTDNNALITADFLCDTDFGFRYTYADHINETALIAAANVCDELVNLANGGTEKRYTCNGVHYSGQSREETINALLASMAGSRAWVNGQWYIFAGAHTTPIMEITESDMRGNGITDVATGYPHNVRFNAVKGTYLEEAQGYQPYDFRFQQSDTFKAQDGGTQLWRDVEYPFTTSGTMAQRLARIELLRNRQMIRVKCQCKFTVLEVIPGEVIELTNSVYGWDRKQFLVTEVTLNFSGDDPGVDLSLQETDSTIFDWNTSLEQTVDPAPNTNLPQPWAIVPPSSVTISDAARTQKDGSEIIVMTVIWDPGADATGMEWIAKWRNTTGGSIPGDSGDEQFSSMRTSQPRIDISPVIKDALYEVQVAAINSVGNVSEYSEAVYHRIVGDSDPPPAVDSLQVYDLPTGLRRAVVRYSQKPEDFAGYAFRYALGQTASWEQLQQLNKDPITTNPYEFTRPIAAGDYRFAVKAIDRSGNESIAAVFADVTLDAADAADYIDEFDFIELGWPGTKTGCHVDTVTGYLLPDTQNTWGGGKTWFSAGTWNGNPVTSYTYEHPEIDFGSDITFTPEVKYVLTATTVTVEEKHKTEAGTYTAYAAISGAITARYLMIRITANL